MIFMGVLFRKYQESYILGQSKTGLSNAANLFQWNVIEGISQNNRNDLRIVNCLPVGCWPKNYKKLYLCDDEWDYNGEKCFEIGGINLPVLKQFFRIQKSRKLIKKLTKNDKEIIIYSAYMPYLKAVYHLPRDVKITLIVTDLPEFYDLNECSGWRKFLRKLQNKMIYKYLNRVDSFVLLTEKMKERLRIGDRPYIVVEGICDSNVSHVSAECENDGIKSILYTGTLHKKFGIGNLLQAFSMIESKDYQLWICGTGDMQDEIKRVAQNDDRIKYFGYVTKQKINELQRQATILVNPRQNNEEYTKYSFPSKTMEYMLSGKPVVMYKLDGIPDEYDEYICYVKDNAVASLKEKIEEVCQLSFEERVKIGLKAADYVLNEKNQIKQANKIIRLLERF